MLSMCLVFVDEESIVGNIEVRYIPYAKLLPDALVLVITKG